MTSPRRELREFHCSEFRWKDGTVTYTHISSPRPQDFLVREVSPDYDQAVERLVEALKSARLGLSVALESEDMECRNDEECDHCELYWTEKAVTEALSAYEKARYK